MSLDEHAVLVDVAGVGYELEVTPDTLSALPGIGQDVALHTHLTIRDDAHLLYGFGSDSERQAFRQLLKITGIGARTALAVLSGMTVDELHQAVAGQDSARLIRVPGIGRKTAERLLLELRDKLHAAGGGGTAGAPASSRDDALTALLALGYSEKEASGALGKLATDTNTADAIRQALRLLSKVV